VNAAERAIQTFKDAFIAALATTDSKFPLQLWDRLTPQVRDTLNLMRASRINPNILAYKALNGPYDCNRYPLVPLGCKAVVYKDGDNRGLWASRGINGWYLGPSKDHYQFALHYIPETRAYRILGLTELFPQHCQLPNLTPDQHFRTLMEELAKETATANNTPTGRCLIELLQSRIKQIVEPMAVITEQEAKEQEQRVRMQQQRVIEETPILTVPCITNMPPIMKSRNPTAKRALKNTPRLHQRSTRNNTPGAVPAIQRVQIIGPNTHIRPEWKGTTNVGWQEKKQGVRRRLPRVQATPPPTTFIPILSGARQRIVTRQAINMLTIQEEAEANDKFTPLCLHTKKSIPTMFEHFASFMVHPITGKIISIYKKLMNDPATAEVWQTAFGKDLGGWHKGIRKRD
jgi:hypothetical protein